MARTDGLMKSAGPISMIKPAFSAGELTPALHSRVDLEKYTQGAKTLKNFIVHPQGGASNRPGLRYIATAKFDGKQVRVIPFEFSVTQKYVIEAGDLYFRFFTNGGQIVKSTATAWATVTPYAVGDYVTSGAAIYYCQVAHTSGTFATDLTAGKWVQQTVYEIVGPYSESQVFDVQYAQSADVLFTVHGSVKPKQITRLGNTNWTVTDYDYQDGPFMLGNTSDTTLRPSGSSAVDQYAGFLAHFDGVDGATAYTAETGQPVTFFGAGTKIATAQKKFGTASLYFDGLSGWVLVPDGPEFAFGSGDFTIDFWIRFETNTSGIKTIFAHSSDNEDYSTLVWNGTAGGWQFSWAVGNVTQFTFTALDTIAINTLYHVALVRSGNTFTFYRDGTSVGTATSSAPYPDYTNSVALGSLFIFSDFGNSMKGWVDEFRVSKGIARWTANFTPPTAAYAGLTSGNTLTASNPIFDPLHAGAIWKLRHYIESQTSSLSLTATGAQASIRCGGTWRIITHGTWTARFNIERSIDQGVTWQVVRTFASKDDNNVSTFQTDDNGGDPYLVRANVTAYTSGTIGIDLTADPFTQEGVVRTDAWVDASHMTMTILREPGLTTATKDWAEGSWSNYRGWPTSISFAQDRLTFGGTRSEPQTEWMTESGDYYSFRRHSPLLATDGISINLPARQLNAINWLLPLGTIVAGTSSTIWTISAVDKVITPTNVAQSPSDYSGASTVLPVIIGNRAIYVQTGGSVVRDLAFSFQDDGYISTNISILATHLFENKTITAMAYQQNPGNLMWLLQSDGAMLSMTYLREQDILAWTKHDTAGSFESICELGGSGSYDEVWFSVKRGTKRYIELMANRLESAATEDQFFMDCGITYDGVPTSVVTGLGHLEGKQVCVLADGNVIFDSETPTTVTSGQITLPAPYSLIHVGLPYTSDLETLNVEVPTASGTAQGKKVKISKLTLLLQNSSGGKIGPDFNTLHEIGGIFTRNYNTAQVLATGPVNENLGAGYEDGGRICIRQTKPLPISILALVPTVTVGGVSLLES